MIYVKLSERQFATVYAAKKNAKWRHPDLARFQQRVLERLSRVEDALESDEEAEELLNVNSQFNNMLTGISEHARQLEYLTNRVQHLEDAMNVLLPVPNKKAGKPPRKLPKQKPKK